MIDPSQQSLNNNPAPIQNDTVATPSPVAPASVSPEQGNPASVSPEQGNPAATGQENSVPDAGLNKPFPPSTRDYKTNPLNKQDEADLHKFNLIATKVIHDPKVKNMIISNLNNNRTHPYETISNLSLQVMNRVEADAHKMKKPWDDAVKLVGGINIVKQITEIAAVTGKVKKNMSEKDFKVIFGETVQKYYQQKMANGEMSPAQVASDAHTGAQLHAQMRGDDVSGVNKQIKATGELQQQGVTADNPGASGVLQAPEPVQDPMHPPTTMKKVLANNQGGLLNG